MVDPIILTMLCMDLSPLVGGEGIGECIMLTHMHIYIYTYTSHIINDLSGEKNTRFIKILYVSWPVPAFRSSLFVVIFVSTDPTVQHNLLPSSNETLCSFT